MTTETLGIINRLRESVEQSNLTYVELEKRTGIAKSSLQRYVQGATKKIPVDAIQAIAKAIGISDAYIMGWDNEQPKNQKRNLIPVLGRVQAGYPSEAVENILDYEEISEEMARNGEFFALKVKGDSMEPKFSEGDVVIVRKQADVDNGDIAIMLVNGDEATIKKIQKFEGGINLIPSNSSYEVITYSNKEIIEKPVICMGKVVELRAKF